MSPPARSLDRPDVVLVHGVGVGPESFEEMKAALVAAGRRVHGVVRPGYGQGEHAMDLEAQVDAITESCELSASRPAVWVGVSGGATLGVIAATRRPATICGAVLHEPLIGSAAPELQASIRRAADALAAGQNGSDDERTASALGYMAGLVGPDGWELLGDEGRAAVAARAVLIGCEVPRFARFEPRAVPADGAVRTVVTVGERSSAARHEAAHRAAELLNGTVEVITGVGHLPQVEAPGAYAELLGALT